MPITRPVIPDAPTPPRGTTPKPPSAIDDFYGRNPINQPRTPARPPQTPLAPTPSPSPAPSPTPRYSAPISYSPGTPVSNSPTGEVAPTAPEAEEPMSDQEWWDQDADYQIEHTSLQDTLQNALAELATKRANYDTDFVTTLKNLGWDWDGDDRGSLDTYAQGQWDDQNPLGAYGQGMGNLNNDFASRGLMDSSFFADALTNFNTDFNNQFSNLGKQRDAYLLDNGDRTGAGLAARTEYQNALARARQLSLARRDASS